MNQDRTSAVAAQSAIDGYGVGTVASRDGTMIGYQVIGQGPGVVLVGGAMGTTYNYDEFARLLASRFTVYLPDRRGRGMSPKAYSPEHTIARDVEDLQAVVDEHGVRFAYGLSSGAMIVLEALRTGLTIEKAVVYEPPFYPSAMPHRLIVRFNREIDRGKLASALVTAGRIVKIGPALLQFAPRALLQLATAQLLRRETANGTGHYAPLAELLPAMRYDFNVVGGMDGKIGSLATIRLPLLLLGGDKSPRYLADALTALQAVIPTAHRVELAGLDHSGSWNRDRGGSPSRVADELATFFNG